MRLMNGKVLRDFFPLIIDFNYLSGIDVVRNKIKTFAQKKVTLPPGRHKIIILDEADRLVDQAAPIMILTSFSMTPGAQQALRRTMEIFSNTTRFCLACNMSNKIIEPIQSRCAILRYAKLRDEEILKRLLEICEMEKVCLYYLFISPLSSKGDIRWNITMTDSLLSFLRRKVTCGKLSTICNLPTLDLASFRVITYSKSVTNHTLSLFKPRYVLVSKAISILQSTN